MYQTQRVKNLLEGYISLWQQGKSPKQIADYFHVTVTTVYVNLQKIAEKNGFSRKELLIAPEHSVVKATITNPLRRETVDAEKIHQDFVQAKESIDSLISLIEKLEEDTL